MKTQEEIHKLVVGTFGTPIGEKLLDHLIKTLLDRPTFKIGMTLEETAFREGQKDVIRQILKEMEVAHGS
jgi:hypothetical protein